MSVIVSRNMSYSLIILSMLEKKNLTLLQFKKKKKKKLRSNSFRLSTHY